MSWLPRAKNCRTDANMGCAFCNGGFQIVRHTHRQAVDWIALIDQFITNVPQTGKYLALMIKVVRGAWNGHQATQSQSGLMSNCGSEWHYFLGWDAGFGYFTFQVYLY